MYFVCCFFAYDWGDPAMESQGTEATRGEGSFFLFTLFPFYPFIFKNFSYASSHASLFFGSNFLSSSELAMI